MLTPPSWFGESVKLPFDRIDMMDIIAILVENASQLHEWFISNPVLALAELKVDWCLVATCNRCNEVWEGVLLCWHCDCTATCHGTRMAIKIAGLAPWQLVMSKRAGVWTQNWCLVERYCKILVQQPKRQCSTTEETWLLTANLYRKLCHLNWENGRGGDQPINLARRTLLAFGFLERIGTGIAVIAFVGGSGVVVLMGNTGRTLYGMFMKHT